MTENKKWFSSLTPL
jgi:hypothetical protein